MTSIPLDILKGYTYREFADVSSTLSNDSIDEYLHYIITETSIEELHTIMCSYVMIFPVLKKFIEAGADPRYRDDIYFVNACRIYNEVEPIRFFLECGADINAQNSLALANAVCYSYDYETRKRDDSIIKFLLENGSEITEKVIIGACYAMQPSVFKLLLKYDADPNLILKHFLDISKASIRGNEFVDCLQVISEYDPDYKSVISQLPKD